MEDTRIKSGRLMVKFDNDDAEEVSEVYNYEEISIVLKQSIKLL